MSHSDRRSIFKWSIEMAEFTRVRKDFQYATKWDRTLTISVIAKIMVNNYLG